MSELPPPPSREVFPSPDSLSAQAAHQVAKETLSGFGAGIIVRRESGNKIPPQERLREGEIGVLSCNYPQTDGAVFGVEGQESTLFALRFEPSKKSGLIPTVEQYNQKSTLPVFSTEKMEEILEIDPARY